MPLPWWERRFRLSICLALVLAAQTHAQIRLIEIDPGHSHLSSLHSAMPPGISDVVDIYSPLTPELTAHLAAITRNNSRAERQTHWTVRLFAGPDYMAQFEKEPPGAIVALSGRNGANIGYIEAALRAGQHVFADKPLIVDPEAFPRFEAAMKLAEEKHLAVMDWMTLREDPAYRLMRDLVQEEPVFGKPLPGSVDHPSVQLENLHALLKYSGTIPQKRPAMFLDNRQQGEGMADVGTHTADLAQWALFPGEKISYRTDIKMLKADHSALTLTLEQFIRLTGETTWPAFLKDRLVDGKLIDYTNGTCVYTLKGVHVRLKVNWQYEAGPGTGDSYFASFLGSRALVELRAGPNEKFTPEVYVTPVTDSPAWENNLQTLLTKLGLSCEKRLGSFRIFRSKPDRAPDGLQKLLLAFAGYVRDWRSFPEYERYNLLAKYYITTSAVAMANATR
jgi:predicted dehydrogenase